MRGRGNERNWENVRRRQKESEKEREGGHLEVGGKLHLQVLEWVPPATTHGDGYTMQCKKG